MSEKVRIFAYHLKNKKTMNANNQQTSFKTHWVNTKTIAETIEILDKAMYKVNMLWLDADGYDDLKNELYDAFNHIDHAIKSMKEAKIVNKLKSKEE